MDFETLPTKIKNHLTEQLKREDPQAEVKVNRTSLGWLKLRIITQIFQDKLLEERENIIDNLLKDIEFNLGQYPMAGYALLTPQEAETEDNKPIQLELPLWSDILMTPEAEQPVIIEEDNFKRPSLVTFYSFKGGVGRSTALGLVAGILASRKRRVVMIDFDLEAPGISVLFRSDIENFEQEKYGVLDYLHQRHITPNENIPSIEDCINKINLSFRGELFLVPAGEYNENYIHRLADLDRGTLQSFYCRENNPINQLIEDLTKRLDPDVILIDARPGFNDTSAIALFDLADLAIICFSPTDQSFEGLRWVVQAIRKQRDYQGKPDLRFLLTPIPVISPEQRQIWINRVEQWIEENWIPPQGVVINELYYQISYNPNIFALTSLVKGIPQSILNEYLPLAETIDASLPAPIPNINIPKITNRQGILNELHFEAATAQEIEAKNLPNIFQRTEDFSEFLEPKTWLILGAKGTGKSMLFRLFVEQPEQAKKLAEPYLDLSTVVFMAGHGQPRLSEFILDRNDLESYEKLAGENFWPSFWLNYALIQLCRSYPELRSLSELDPELIELTNSDHPLHRDIVLWLVKRANSAEFGLKAGDEFRIIDRWLTSKNQKVWLLYDELDAGFGSSPPDYQRRRRAIEALLSWWLESGTSFKQIIPKIFLREDIWQRLNFTNKGHYTTHRLELKWEEADLWRLVLRQALNSSRQLRNDLEEQLGVTVPRLENIDLEQLRKTLYALWGERMKSANKAYIYNWIRKRITDNQGTSFPRSLIVLLEEAINREKKASSDSSQTIVLRPKSLTDAFPEVSKQRVAEVRNEYPELEELLDKLQNQRSPIDEAQLATIWELDNITLSRKAKDFVDAGIFKEISRSDSRAYSVAELYLYGLSMIRSGPR